MQAKEDFRTAPSKLPRLDYSGCWGMDGNGSNRGVSGLQQPVGLGLELGCGGGSGQDRPLTDFTRCHGFTFLQLQELQLQSIIYKYIEAGFPVPYHLVLPIWKSVNNSFGGLNGNLYQFFPRFMGCSPLYLDNYRNGMDPEPGRCRRTDGKKWRCSKEAVPEHKYCERHMHRGRQQRSRKLVEAASQDSTTAITNLSISLPAVSSSTSSTSISPRCVL